MPGILLLVIIIQSVFLVTLFHKIGNLREENQKYKVLAWEWYMYLNDKKHSEDFSLWHKEMDD